MSLTVAVDPAVTYRVFVPQPPEPELELLQLIHDGGVFVVFFGVTFSRARLEAAAACVRTYARTYGRRRRREKSPAEEKNKGGGGHELNEELQKTP